MTGCGATAAPVVRVSPGGSERVRGCLVMAGGRAWPPEGETCSFAPPGPPPPEYGGWAPRRADRVQPARGGCTGPPVHSAPASHLDTHTGTGFLRVLCPSCLWGSFRWPTRPRHGLPVKPPPSPLPAPSSQRESQGSAGPRAPCVPASPLPLPLPEAGGGSSSPRDFALADPLPKMLFPPLCSPGWPRLLLQGPPQHHPRAKVLLPPRQRARASWRVAVGAAAAPEAPWPWLPTGLLCRQGLPRLVAAGSGVGCRCAIDGGAPGSTPGGFALSASFRVCKMGAFMAPLQGCARGGSPAGRGRSLQGRPPPALPAVLTAGTEPPPAPGGPLPGSLEGEQGRGRDGPAGQRAPLGSRPTQAGQGRGRRAGAGAGAGAWQRRPSAYAGRPAQPELAVGCRARSCLPGLVGSPTRNCND